MIEYSMEFDGRNKVPDSMPAVFDKFVLSLLTAILCILLPLGIISPIRQYVAALWALSANMDNTYRFAFVNI